MNPMIVRGRIQVDCETSVTHIIKDEQTVLSVCPEQNHGPLDGHKSMKNDAHKNPATSLHEEIDSLYSDVAGFFVGIDFLVVYSVQRSLPIQHLAKSCPDCTGAVVYQKVIIR